MSDDAAVKLPPPSGTVYGNPPPIHYGDGNDERRSLEGRMVVQAGRFRRARRDGREQDERCALRVLDELLDHWWYADSRRVSRAIEDVEWPRPPERAPIAKRADGPQINGHTGESVAEATRA